MYFFMLFGILDNILLTVMAYDQFVAIYHPLQYMIIMNPKFCDFLILTSWLVSFLDSLLHGFMILWLSVCTKLEIHHFFLANFMGWFSLFVLTLYLMTWWCILQVEFWLSYPGILFCYSKIVSSILKISSMRGKYKAFSTCVSHLSTVSLFYGTSHGVYVSSADTQNSEATAIASVMYTVVIPMLNPFIYILKNKDIKQALKTLFSIVHRTWTGNSFLTWFFTCFNAILLGRDTCTPMFIVALFIIARTWKQPRCPSADEWIRKLWYIYTLKRIHLNQF